MALSAEQREHLEQRLREERDRALSALNRSLADSSGESEQERAGDLTKLPFHPADLGTDAINQEIEMSLDTRVSSELADIDDALDRLYRDPEHFGICADTGKEIPLERLELIPWARTCDQASDVQRGQSG